MKKKSAYGVSDYQYWTQSAKDCYFIGCMCSKCFIYKILGKKCKMKEAVFELVRKLGRPDGEGYEE